MRLASSRRGLKRPPCYFTVRLVPLAPLKLPQPSFSSSSTRPTCASLVSLPNAHESLGKLLSSSCKRLPDRPSLHLLSFWLVDISLFFHPSSRSLSFVVSRLTVPFSLVSSSLRTLANLMSPYATITPSLPTDVTGA